MFVKLLVTAFCLTILAAKTVAQVASGCPVVNLFGPAGLVARGALARYTVEVTPDEAARIFTYKWSSSAVIKSGQGTQTLEVIQPESCLTVTVEISGQSEKCPTLFSEAKCIDWASPAEKLAEISGILTSKNVAFIKEAIAKHQDRPNDQFYFIVSGTNRKNSRDRKLTALKRLFKSDFNRATYVISEKTDDKVTMWAVPPGTTPPTP